MSVDSITDDVKRLIAEGLDEQTAMKAVLARCDSVATLMTPGPYVYGEGTGDYTIRYKRAPDIKRMVESEQGKYVPVHETHDGGKITGIAYGWEYDAATGKAKAKIIPRVGHELEAGDGVSPGFKSVEVACSEGTCQTEMRLEHVAASASLIPRGDTNRVDSMENTELVAKVAVLEKELEKRDSTINELKKDSLDMKLVVDGYQTAERDALVKEVTPHVKEGAIKFDAMSLDELKRFKVVIDSLNVTKAEDPNPRFNDAKTSDATTGGYLKGTGW